MLKNNQVAILDIGSHKITVLVGEHGINNTLNIKGKSEVAYGGFSDGEFLESDKLAGVFKEVIALAEDCIKSPIKKFFIGVPGEFTTAVCKDSSISFKTKRKVTEIDIQELYKSGEAYQSGKYVLINRSPIYFIVDENRRVINPLRMPSNKLSGKLSFIFAEIKFIDTIKDILNSIGVIQYEFLSSTLAESLILFEERDKQAIFADVGYITTTVAVSQGDGLTFMKSFSAGGAYIASDLMECLHIPFDTAEKLKEKLSLNLMVGEEDKTIIEIDNNVTEVPTKTANEIVSARIEMLANMIKQCLKESPESYLQHLPLHLTGGGISYIRGAKDILSMVLDRNVEIISPQIPKASKPHLSSSYGVLSLALRQTKENRKGFWSKIFG